MKIEAFSINKAKPKISNKKLVEAFIVAFLFFFAIAFITNSEKYIASVLNGIILYGTKVLPSLFPFFFITKLLSEFNLVFSLCNKFRWFTKFFFNTPAISFYIFFMSIISGYPVGAKLTAEFYENGLITKKQAHKIITFSSTSGPLFIIGSVGIGFFKSFKLGLVIFIAHSLGAFINGILYRKCYNNDDDNLDNTIINKEVSSNILETTMYNSIMSALIVGGYIIIFNVLIDILLDFNVLSLFIKLFSLIFKSSSIGFVSGIIEVTKGCHLLSLLNNSFMLSAVLVAGIISFGGFSIHFQALTFLNRCEINKKFYFLQKITHALISMCLCFLICLFFKL